MALEWHRAMSHLPEECVVAAVERYIGSPATRFPVPGQIIELAKPDVDSLRRLVYANRDRYIAPVSTDPGPTLEEIARVKKLSDEWRAKVRDEKKQAVGNRMDEWAPASKAETVSGTVRQTCAARRTRGLPTCTDHCQRPLGSKNCSFNQERQEGAADEPLDTLRKSRGAA